jgi:hypothetical protein
MINFSAKSVIKKLSNIPGWHTQQHLVVFESDDWGSIRMPSINSFDRLEKLGLDLRSADAERYNLNDTLATSNDLESLFEVLSNVKDRLGNYAVFTPVTILANPDFQKIKGSGFQEYFYEPFTATLKRYPGCEHSFDLWREGIEKKVFVPQMHGREHLNVTAWMKALQTGENDTLQAFKEGMWGFVPVKYPEVDYQAAFLLGNLNELKYQEKAIIEGLELFKTLFGYTAEYFVPPNGPFNNSLNKVLVHNGIKFRNTSKMQNETLGNGESRKVIHWLGQKDKTCIRYILRNCFFEPSLAGKDWIDSCLNDIKIAFRWHKPAIISSHRVNYIGSLSPANRDKGLKQLSQLLCTIMKNWPDIIFMTTSELGKIISKKPE